MSRSKILAILAEMSVAEKIALCSGADFWHTKAFSAYGIPSMLISDGPHGLRKKVDPVDALGLSESIPATCFPCAGTSACSWDTELLAEIGAAIAAEGRAEAVGLILGPGVNIKRNPLCGRNFEYFSEDPYLTGKLAASYIRGGKQSGVAMCLKHFACNNQEDNRFRSDSVIDERSLREIYLSAFEIAIKEGEAAAVMCAYNKVNGVYCSDSGYLLHDILRCEWGFRGLVVTDWGAMNDRIAAFRAGCDLNMPGASAYMEADAEAALRAGEWSEADLDASAERLLNLIFEAAAHLAEGAPCDKEAHHALARKAAAESAVLLKNEEGILPLEGTQGLAFIGHMAKKARFQGLGSSRVQAARQSSVLDLMPEIPFAAGCLEDGSSTDELLAEAEAVARKADKLVVWAGLTDAEESEGFDRENMKMSEAQIRMIERLATANPNVIVVLCCGTVVEAAWAERVKAILYMGLAGQAGSEATLDLLFGRVNPSGKLAESWPVNYEDCPSSTYYKGCVDAQYREGIYVGYRYYDKARMPLRWPFGFGLSYTDFHYSDLRIDADLVSVVIKNTGKRAGAEVVQLYIEPPSGGLHRADRELKGFAKVFLQPDESKELCFPLDERSLALWSDGWKVAGGSYTIHVGPHSRQLPLSVSTERAGSFIPAAVWQSGTWYEKPQAPPSQKDWERMLGRSYCGNLHTKASFTMNNSIREMKETSLPLKILYKIIEWQIAKKCVGKKDDGDPTFRMMMSGTCDSPLRTLQINSGRRGSLFQGIVDIANGHGGRGIKKILSHGIIKVSD